MSEKEIPKRALFVHMTSDTKARYKCECGNNFIHECEGFPFEHMQYCDMCGQKFDWSEEDICELEAQ